MELAEIVMNPVRQRIFQYFCFMKPARSRKSGKRCRIFRVQAYIGISRFLRIVPSSWWLAKIEFAVQWKAFINSIRMLWLRKMKPEMRYRCRCWVSALPLQNIFHRQCRSAKGYAAVHELYAAADRRGIFEVPFGDQSGYGQVHETGKLGKQQTAENHAHFRPDERVGAGYAKEMKVSERIDCPQILLRTDWQALLADV